MSHGRNGAVGRVNVEVELANNEDVVLVKRGGLPPEQVRRAKIRGFVDTGATRLVLPDTAVAQLGLAVSGQTRVRYADQRYAERDVVENVWLEMNGRHGVFSAIVEPGRSDALIGAIVMEELDLLVDCARQIVQPRDPNTTISEVE